MLIFLVQYVQKKHEKTHNILFFQEGERVVTKKEGIDFARQYGCLFLECSAKTRINVEQCFEELVLKVHTKLISVFILFLGQVENLFEMYLVPYHFMLLPYFVFKIMNKMLGCNVNFFLSRDQN